MNFMTVSENYIKDCELYAKERATLDVDKEDPEILDRFIEIFNDVLFGNKSMGG